MDKVTDGGAVYDTRQLIVDHYRMTLNEYLTTRELADLLRIKERKVYDLASSGEIPCTRATGKLLFSRRAIDAWLIAHGEGMNLSATKPALPLVFLGSNDPLLDWALKASECGIATYFSGSSNGLERFVNGEGVGTALHIFDPGENDWNIGHVTECSANRSAVLLSFCRRTRGIVYCPSIGEGIDLKQMLSNRVVRRQAGAGAQVLLEHLLAESGIAVKDINFVETAHTESDAALAVAEGRADAAAGLQCFAVQHQLGFMPLTEERFDLLVNRKAWFDEPMQRFKDFCRSEMFADRAATLPGYDISDLFSVRLN